MDRFPAPAYTETVLRENFRDVRDHFLDHLIDIHFAHLLMLERQGIVHRTDAKAIAAALRGLDRDALRGAEYDGSHEDFFFYLEAELARQCDPDVAGRLHTARSRNDIDITLYRMKVRTELLAVHDRLLSVAGVLLVLAETNVDTVMPAHTHTQPAQPTTLSHYLLGAIECLDRDLRRLEAAYATVNRNPLGSCAITTTGFPIDRDLTSRLLGFDGLQVNSYGAIAAVDYLLEAASAISIAAINSGKLVHDLLLWSMQEFSWLRLSDAFVQTSSIMTQKSNHVALEHVRILLSRAHTEAQAVISTAHNTPFGDIVDSEDDLVPLVVTMFADARRAFELLGAALDKAEVDRDLLRCRAGARFLTATELADTLVRLEGISFREAHHIVSSAVRAAGNDSHEMIVDQVLRVAGSEFGRDLDARRPELLAALDPVRFVEIRNVTGGPAPVEVRLQLGAIDSALSVHRKWRESTEDRLSMAAMHLRHDVQALLKL